jgi:hypothetical protein
MTDAQFTQQAENAAVAMGWSRDLARLIAHMTGQKPAGPKPAAARAAVKGKAAPQRVSLDRLVALAELPPAVASELRAVGIASTEAAMPLLSAYVRGAARGSPASAAIALRLSLLARKVYSKGTKQ